MMVVATPPSDNVSKRAIKRCPAAPLPYSSALM
jgi:hypothetical protein